MVGGEVKVATVTSENLDTMATLPISVSRHSHQQHSEKTLCSVAAKEKEQKSQPRFIYQQIKRLVATVKFVYNFCKTHSPKSNILSSYLIIYLLNISLYKTDIFISCL